MLKEEIQNLDSSIKGLRKFGITLASAFAVVAALTFFHKNDFYWVFIVLCGAFLFFGLILPAFLKPVQKVWMTLAHMMGWVMTRLILTVLFYLIITPIGLIMKVCGKDILNVKFERDCEETYWLKRIPQPDRNYEKQF